jgi:catechol 2,3-dioxygenase-like lactoylglutathione lyase family enzyme
MVTRILHHPYVRLVCCLTALWPLLAARGVVTARGTAGSGQASAVDAVSMVVGDMDRSVDFFVNVLTFEKIADVEVTGDEYERLEGLFGIRLRVVRLQLGQERLELMQFVAPEGRAVPADSRSNDRWFQHVAIIVSDMSRAYARLREHKVRHASAGPQRLPDWNPNAGGIEALYFKDPDGHTLEILAFPPGIGTFGVISAGVVRLERSDFGFSKGTLLRDPDGHAVMLAER